MKTFFTKIFPTYLSAVAALVVAWVAVFTVGPILDKYALQKETEALKEELIVLQTLVERRNDESVRLDAKNRALEEAVVSTEHNNRNLTAHLKKLRELNKLEEEQNRQLAKARQALLAEIDILQQTYASHLGELIALNVRAQLAEHLRTYARAEEDPLSMLMLVWVKQDDGAVTGRSFVKNALNSSEFATTPRHVQDKISKIVKTYVDGRADLYDTDLQIPNLIRAAIRDKLPNEIDSISVGKIRAGNFGSYQEAWEMVQKEIMAEINGIREVAVAVEHSLSDLKAAIVSERRTLTSGSK